AKPALLDQVIALLVIDFVVLLPSLCPSPEADADALRGYSRHISQPRHRLTATPPDGVELDLGRSRVLLHVEPTRLRIQRAVQIDRECVFGHVGIVEPVASDAFPGGPTLQSLQILAEAVAEHARARGIAKLR